MNKLKRNTTKLGLSVIVITGILTDNYLGYSELGNISMAILWLSVFTSIAISYADKAQQDKVFNSASEFRIIKNIFSGAIVATLIVCGWFVTAVFYSISWTIVHSSYIDWKKEQEKSNETQT